jgi:hypothetical protein
MIIHYVSGARGRQLVSIYIVVATESSLKPRHSLFIDEILTNCHYNIYV